MHENLFTLVVFCIPALHIMSDNLLKVNFDLFSLKVIMPQSHNADQNAHREEEPQNTNSNKTQGRKLKLNNQLSRPHQNDCKTRKGTISTA